MEELDAAKAAARDACRDGRPCAEPVARLCRAYLAVPPDVLAIEEDRGAADQMLEYLRLQEEAFGLWHASLAPVLLVCAHLSYPRTTDTAWFAHVRDLLQRALAICVRAREPSFMTAPASSSAGPRPSDDPILWVTEARVLELLGEVFLKLKLSDKALACGMRALWTRMLHEHSPVLWPTLELLSRATERASVRAAFAEATVQRQELEGADDCEIAKSLTRWASALLSIGDVSSASKTAERALELLERRLENPAHNGLVYSLYILRQAAKLQGDLKGEAVWQTRIAACERDCSMWPPIAKAHWPIGRLVVSDGCDRVCDDFQRLEVARDEAWFPALVAFGWLRPEETIAVLWDGTLDPDGRQRRQLDMHSRHTLFFSWSTMAQQAAALCSSSVEPPQMAAAAAAVAMAAAASAPAAVAVMPFDAAIGAIDARNVRDLVVLLKQQGLTPQQKSALLLHAVRSGHVPSVKKLLAEDADPQYSDGITSILEAAASNSALTRLQLESWPIN
jgi:hypothetical protein